jgi:hypothetical protein
MAAERAAALGPPRSFINDEIKQLLLISANIDVKR